MWHRQVKSYAAEARSAQAADALTRDLTGEGDPGSAGKRQVKARHGGSAGFPRMGSCRPRGAAHLVPSLLFGRGDEGFSRRHLFDPEGHPVRPNSGSARYRTGPWIDEPGGVSAPGEFSLDASCQNHLSSEDILVRGLA
jgi:hypothetical protein